MSFEVSQQNIGIHSTRQFWEGLRTSALFCVCLLCRSHIFLPILLQAGFPHNPTRLLMQTIKTAVSLSTLWDRGEGYKTKRVRSQKAGITIEIRFLMRTAFVPVRRYMSNCSLKPEFPQEVKEQLLCALIELEYEGKKLVRSAVQVKAGGLGSKDLSASISGRDLFKSL